jgi:regulator of nucleoside diphosphate kinase
MSTIVSSLDRERLETVLGPEQADGWPLHRLRTLFESSKVVNPKKVPGDVVTMNSRVRIRDLQWDEVETVTLVYPEDASQNEGRVSVTSPLGAALLGARVGEEARWIGARGPRRVIIEAIEFQPEKAGRFDL